MVNVDIRQMTFGAISPVNRNDVREAVYNGFIAGFPGRTLVDNASVFASFDVMALPVQYASGV